MNTQELGVKGEKFAARYLKKNKYKLFYRNFRTGFGEVDIIAEKGDIIAFVEVKTRTAGQMLDPSASVDQKKQARILSAANSYMSIYKVKKQPRFDIAEVVVDQKGKFSINYIENAFA